MFSRDWQGQVGSWIMKNFIAFLIFLALLPLILVVLSSALESREREKWINTCTNTEKIARYLCEERWSTSHRRER